MPTKHDVIRVHKEHPDWTVRQVADHLGCMREYVTATAKRNGLTFRKVAVPRTKEDLLAEAARLIERAKTAPSEKEQKHASK